MQIVIDISDEEYEDVKKAGGCYYDFGKAIYYGTPLPKGHGRLIDADVIPSSVELKGFLAQDDMHLVTIDRVKQVLSNLPTIIKADKAESEVES